MRGARVSNLSAHLAQNKFVGLLTSSSPVVGVRRGRRSGDGGGGDVGVRPTVILAPPAATRSSPATRSPATEPGPPSDSRLPGDEGSDQRLLLDPPPSPPCSASSRKRGGNVRCSTSSRCSVCHDWTEGDRSAGAHLPPNADREGRLRQGEGLGDGTG